MVKIKYTLIRIKIQGINVFRIQIRALDLY